MLTTKAKGDKLCQEPAAGILERLPRVTHSKSTMRVSNESMSTQPITYSLDEQPPLASKDVLSVADASPKSYVRNCLRIYRPGENLFTIANNGQGPILATLDGYAIVPIGHYYDLIGQELPETLRQFAGDAQAFAGWNKRRDLSGE